MTPKIENNVVDFVIAILLHGKDCNLAPLLHAREHLRPSNASVFYYGLYNL